MNYEEWKIESAKLYELVDIAEENLNSVISELLKKYSLKPQTNGLIHDEIKNDLKYKEAKYSFNLAFQNYRKFNANSSKKFMQKRASEDRKNKILKDIN